VTTPKKRSPIMLDGNTDDTIRDILTTTRRIALVGASAKPWRASHEVMRFLLEHCYDVTPVNPSLAGQTIHGRMVVASLADAAPLEMVDVFRASVHVAALVDRAIDLGARTIWLQLGVIDRDAAAKARAAGIRVVMDRCPVIEDRRIGPFGAVRPHPVRPYPVRPDH
jgi:predicted CoA-binding protein